jgi:hypothetical protein
MRYLLLLLAFVCSASQAARYQICTGEFAFCGASSAVPTGNLITVATPTGTAQFNEALAVCPVMNGNAVADVKGGNMQGSCAVSADGHVWSLFATFSEVPTSPTWDVNTVVPRLFVSGSDANFSQMFSFDCVKTEIVNGVQLADCFGAINESLTGAPVPAGTTMLTEAPLGSILPVSGSLP